MVMTRLKRWIQNCDSICEGCHVDEIPILPTRVLALAAESSSPLVKLVETKNVERGAYVSLSHCWGSSHSFITTKDNIEDRKKGFLIDNAPATFQDTIAVARGLGIYFIWIDSLCIVQDDHNDWNIESSRMCDIYRNATVTIAAASAAADSEGFLRPRLPRDFKLTISSKSGHSTEVFLRAKAPNTEQRYREHEVTHIDKRGWCLQEAYLSRRQLKFLDDRILWACRDEQFDELLSSDESIGQKAWMGTVSQVRNLFRGNTPRRHRTLNTLTPYQGWYNMIKDYKSRSLTFASDVFPALSGLASEVADHDKGRYCAGVWWEDAAFGICWKKKSVLSKADDYIAPSWSWASCIGPIEFLNDNEVWGSQTVITVMTRVNFHNFHVKYRGVNKYGQIDNEWIKLEAPMAAIECADQENIYLDGVDIRLERVEWSFDLDGDGAEKLQALFLMRRDDNSKMSYADLKYLGKKPEDAIVFGLIIRPVAHDARRCEALELQDDSQIYERAGFFRMLTSKTREDLWNKLSAPIILV